jgi:hypothetical protein
MRVVLNLHKRSIRDNCQMAFICKAEEESHCGGVGDKTLVFNLPA